MNTTALQLRTSCPHLAKWGLMTSHICDRISAWDDTYLVIQLFNLDEKIVSFVSRHKILERRSGKATNVVAIGHQSPDLSFTASLTVRRCGGEADFRRLTL